MVKNNKKIKISITKVSIILLTLDNLELIKNSLLNITKLDTNGLDVECIIVNNGSKNNIKKYLKDYKISNMTIKYIPTGINLGFAGGNNIGIKYALANNSKYILLLNDDMILQRDLLIKLVEFLNDNLKVGLVSPKIYFAKGYEFHKSNYSDKDLGNVIWYAGGKIDWDNIYTSHIGVDEVDKGQFDQISQTEVANGACLLIRSEVLKKIGLFNEDFYLYWEDADFSQRVNKNGFEVYYYPGTSIWHKVSISAGGSGGLLNDYFLTRNRYYFAMMYAKTRTKFAVFRDTLKLAIFGRLWQKAGARDAILGRKGAGTWKK